MSRVFLLIAITTVFLSCNKQNEDDAADCKMTKITLGYSGPIVEFAVSYSGKNISELISAYEKYTFTYDASGNMVKKERFATLTNELMSREELSYSSTGQIVNYKFYPFSNSASGEMTMNRDFSYTGSKLTEMKTFLKGNSQTFNDITRIAWEGDNPYLMTTHDSTGRQTGCLNGAKIIVDKSKENPFKKRFPAFHHLDISSGDPLSFLFSAKNIITKIETGCQPPPNNGYNFRYTFDSKGLITEIYRDDFLFRKFDYDCD